MDWVNSSVNPCRVDSSSGVLHPSGIAALLILPWQWINPLSSSPKLNWFITQLLEGGSDFSIFSSSEKQYCCMVCTHPSSALFRSTASSGVHVHTALFSFIQNCVILMTVAVTQNSLTLLLYLLISITFSKFNVRRSASFVVSA